MDQVIPVAIRKILVRCLAAGILAAGLSLTMEQRYRSTATILPSAGDERSNALHAAASMLGVATGFAQEDPTASFPDILRSRWLGEKLVTTRFSFDRRWGMFGPRRHFQQTLQEYLGARSVDKALVMLPEIFSVRRDLKSGLLTLSVESHSPELSQATVRLATQLLEEFLKFRQNSRGKAKAVFVAERLKAARAESDREEAAFRAFLAVNKNYQTSGSPEVRLQGAKLEAALVLRRQVVTALSLNLEQALQQEKDSIPALNILDEGSLPMEKSGPARSLFVICSMALAFLVQFAFDRRRFIMENLRLVGLWLNP